jgi:hypothetical protein
LWIAAFACNDNESEDQYTVLHSLRMSSIILPEASSRDQLLDLIFIEIQIRAPISYVRDEHSHRKACILSDRLNLVATHST